jgi:hypothetical protein
MLNIDDVTILCWCCQLSSSLVLLCQKKCSCVLVRKLQQLVLKSPILIKEHDNLRDCMDYSKINGVLAGLYRRTCLLAHQPFTVVSLQ